MSNQESGFLGRWSRRKTEARIREAEEARPEPVEPAINAPAAVPVDEAQARAVESPAGEDTAPALPTLDDVAALTRESDYSLFVQRKVAPEVRNAAMKKLFSDPHFNIMDGLDIYIDDYSNPEVMPHSMLRQLASARVLNLLTEAELAEDALNAAQAESQASPEPDIGKTPAAVAAPDMVDSPTPQDSTSVADSAPSQEAPPSLDAVVPAAKPYPSGQA